MLTSETRVGVNDVTFEAYRFRCVGPDGADTPVGRFLRRHGLVWLPQLLNVLKGEDGDGGALVRSARLFARSG